MTVRVLMLEPPEDLLAERERLGLDKRDEMWDGVLHVVPPAGNRHQDVGSQLLALLLPLARERGLRLQYETGFFRPRRDDDYRVPDLAVFRSGDASRRGLEGSAEAVVEIRSPGDESYEKIPFYLEHGVADVVVIDRDTLVVEVFREMVDAEPVRADDTEVRCLDVRLERIHDDLLRVHLPDGTSHDVVPDL